MFAPSSFGFCARSIKDPITSNDVNVGWFFKHVGCLLETMV